MSQYQALRRYHHPGNVSLCKLGTLSVINDIARGGSRVTSILCYTAALSCIGQHEGNLYFLEGNYVTVERHICQIAVPYRQTYLNHNIICTKIWTSTLQRSQIRSEDLLESESFLKNCVCVDNRRGANTTQTMQKLWPAKDRQRSSQNRTRKCKSNPDPMLQTFDSIGIRTEVYLKLQHRKLGHP